MTRIEDISQETLKRYFQWPSYDGFTTRCMTDYVIVTAKKGTPIRDMFANPRNDNSYNWVCRGTLLPRPGCGVEGIRDIEISFVNYTIDFGNDREDAASRGYWVESRELRDKKVWYKMEVASPDFTEQSLHMENRLREFMCLHDALALSKSDPRQLIICNMNVEDFWKESKKPFSLSFLKENSEFVLSNLSGSIDPHRSVLFINSIGQLAGLDDAKIRRPFGLSKAKYEKLLEAAKEQYNSRNIETRVVPHFADL